MWLECTDCSINGFIAPRNARSLNTVFSRPQLVDSFFQTPYVSLAVCDEAFRTAISHHVCELFNRVISRGYIA